MPDLDQARAPARLRLICLLAGMALIGLAGSSAQAESGDGQASPNGAAAMAPNEAPASASTVSNDPATGSLGSNDPGAGSTVSNEPAAEMASPPQKLLCMWRNKGVTGFCDVAAETPVGTSCSCRSIIEHKAKKFSGKVIVSR